MRMFTKKMVFAILFILGVSLLNVAVLIEASNHENQITVDAFEQQPLPVVKTVFTKKTCNSGRCNKPDTGNCTETNGYC